MAATRNREISTCRTSAPHLSLFQTYKSDSAGSGWTTSGGDFRTVLGDQIYEFRGQGYKSKLVSTHPLVYELTGTAEGKCRGIGIRIYESVEISKSASRTTNLNSNELDQSVEVNIGSGRGVVLAQDGEFAFFTANGVERILRPGGSTVRGAALFRTDSTGKLASLNNLFAVFEHESYADGTFVEKGWEWR